MDNYNTFCPKCGQRYRTSRKSLSAFLVDFLQVNLNLDNKLFKTIAGLMKPGFLTKQYFAGVQKTYTMPLQFFFGIAVIFFAILSFKVGDLSEGESRLEKQTRRQAQLKSMEILRDSVQSDSILNLNPAQIERIDSLFAESKDISLPRGTQTASLFLSEFEVTTDSMFFNDRGFPLTILLEKTPTEFIDENFAEENFITRQLNKQLLRLSMSGGTYVQYLIKQSPLYIVISLPFLAILFQLLYWRRKFYFVEHLVFLLHIVCFGFIIYLLPLLLGKLDAPVVISVLTIAIFIYVLLAMKYFYGQGWGKTVLKYFIALIFGMVAVTTALMVVLLISLMLF